MSHNLPEPPPPRTGGRFSRGAVIATIVVVMLAAVGIGAASVLRGAEESLDAASEPTPTPSASRSDGRPEPTSRASAAPASPGHERYTSAEFGYTVEYPDGWNIDYQPGGDADVEFFFFEDEVGITAALDVDVLEGVAFPPKQTLNLVVAQHEADLTQYKVIDRTDESVGGLPASTLEDTWVMRGGVRMSALHVAISDGGNVFVFTYTGTDFEKHRSEAEAIIESFRQHGIDPPYL